MERKKYAIFVAGGSGTRMGASVPKQFLELEGVPILQRSILKFVAAVPDVKIITVLPHDFIEAWKAMNLRRNFDVPQTIVEGGFTRFHSVQNALKKVPDYAVVAIHDGVRPLVSPELIRKMYAGMDSCRALVPVVPIVDTLTILDKSEDGTLLDSGKPAPDRSSVYAVQTPQMFLSEDIKSAYTLAYDTSFTDDASVARRKGIPISYTLGDRYNVKITTPDDLSFARQMLE